MITIGLVAEGPHDLITLSALIAAEVAKKTGEAVKFKHLQPYPDATGEYSGGGWARVVAWCLENTGEHLKTFFAPLFAGDTACDILVIHLDGDAMNLVAPHTVVQLPAKPTTDQARVEYLKDAVLGWLQPTEEHSKTLVFAVPILQTEAWVLLAEGVVADCEKINAKEAFRATHVRGRLADYYDRRARLASRRIDYIAAASYSYRAFREGLEVHISTT